MGKVLINGGGGGAGGLSDDMAVSNGITADLVPEGMTYIGADTDDEIGTGTMDLSDSADAQAAHVLEGEKFFTDNSQLPNNPAVGTMVSVPGIEDAKNTRVANSKLILAMTNGAHITNNTGQNYPEVQTPYSSVASTLGVTAAKIATGSSIAGVNGTYTGLGNATQAQVLSGRTFSTSTLSNKTGTMPNVDASENRKNYVMNSSNGNLYLRMTNGAHVTNASGVGYPEVYISQADVAKAYSVTADKIAYGQTIMGVKGTNYGGQQISSASPFAGGKFGDGVSLNNFDVWSWGSNIGEYSGSNSKSFANNDHIHITFQNYRYDKSMSHSSGAVVAFNKQISFSTIKTITMTFMVEKNNSSFYTTGWFYFQAGTTNGGTQLGKGYTTFTPNVNTLSEGTLATTTWNVSNITANGYISIHFEGGSWDGGDSNSYQWHYIPFINIYSLTFQ